jgi:hypothetical protein
MKGSAEEQQEKPPTVNPHSDQPQKQLPRQCATRIAPVVCVFMKRPVQSVMC